MRKSFGFWVLLMCMVLLTIGAQAQVGQSGLTGQVIDPTGAVVPQARIELRGEDGSVIRTVISDANGAYVIPSLQPGHYTLTVSATSFVTQRTSPFDLNSGQTAAINFTLKVGSTSMQVTVEAVEPVLQTTSESLGSTLSATEMTAIPLLGRSFLNALTLSPGVVPVPPAGSTTVHNPTNTTSTPTTTVMPSVFGQRQKDNNFMLDGVGNRDPNLLGVAIYPPPDAIKEMSVDSGVGSSAYGHGSGATVDVVTKSGTPQYHGTLWEYWRNNILDANTFPNPSVGQYHWNQFGFEAGGPLVFPWLLSTEKKWYAYGYYEGIRITAPANATALVPTPAEISGDFSADANPIYDPNSAVQNPVTGKWSRTRAFPNNKIDVPLNASAVTIAKAIYPAPNYIGVVNGVNYINRDGTHTNGNQWNVRVDHQFGQRNSFFARYSGAFNPTTSASLPSVRTTTTDRISNAVVSDTFLISKSMVLTARYGLTGINYFTGNTNPPGIAHDSGLGPVFPPFLGEEILPPITVGSYAKIPLVATVIGPAYQNSGIVDVHKTAGRHTISFGGEIIQTHEVQGSLASTGINFLKNQTSNLTDTVATGNEFASFLLGVPDSATRQIGGSQVDQASYGYGFYIQDTWRNGPLTLSGGLRYDYVGPPVNSYGIGTYDYEKGTYVFDKTNPITGEAATLRPGGYPPDRNNFAPRLGIAYQLTPKTVVRSSGGIFYNIYGSNYIQTTQSNAGSWPFATPQSAQGLNANVVNAVLPNPFPSDPAGSTTTTGCSQCLNVDKDSSRTPYVSEWVLSVQRQFGDSLVFEVAYFGAKGSKLTAQIIDNVAPAPGATTPYPRRFAGVGTYVLNGYNEFNSSYNGLATRVQRQFSHGLSFLGTYTYSKNINQADNLSSGNIFGTATENPTRFNADLNRGLAGFDVTHVLAATATWQIPGRTNYHWVNAVISGWQLSDIFTFRSGLPFSLYISGDNENVGTISGRSSQFPSQVGSSRVAHRTPNQWFNNVLGPKNASDCASVSAAGGAFCVPAKYTRGNMKRNPAELRGGTLINDDMTLSKHWDIFSEKRQFELRGEFFNLFNHTNYGMPGQTVGASNFGVVSNTLNSGRIVQLVAKFTF